MPSYRSVAASVAYRKSLYPEEYCPTPRCLWHTKGGYCPRHKHFETEAQRKTQDGR
jgi:hypothetical protein